MALEILFNHDQTRIDRDRLPLIAKGGEMELSIQRSGAWIEPSHDRVILEPYCLTDAWVTSNSGNYAKLALSSFTATGTWETRTHTGLIAGPWLAIADTSASGSLVTTTTYSKNRGFWVACHVYAQTKGVVVLQGGWNNSASSASGVSFSLYSDGTVIVYKDAVEFGRGKIGIQKNGTAELMLLPYAHRELLVYSPDGEGQNQRGSAFSVLFDDIAEDAADPTITGATNFWLTVPSGGTQVMAAPLLFPTSGYVTSVKQSFIDPPLTTDVLEEWVNDSWVGAGPTYPYRVYGHPPYVGTASASAVAVDWSGSSFTANGTNIEARLKLTLTTSSSSYTPTVYGAQLAYAARFASTDDSEVFDATAYCLSASLSVPEDPAGVSLSLSFREPAALEADIPNFRRATNLPCKFSVDGVPVIDGRTNSPTWKRMPTDGSSTVEVEVRDGWKGAENYRYAEVLPLDDLQLTGVLIYLAAHCGIEDTATTITSDAFTLPMQTTGAVDGWSVLVETGDSPAQWLAQLIEDYAATWVQGLRPDGTGIEYFALSPADVGTTPVVTLWRSAADSFNPLLGNHSTNPHKWVYRMGSTVETLEPEATEVRVSGYEAISGRLIQAYKVDSNAEDVTTAPSSRPVNWVGEKRRVGVENIAITQQSVCNSATELLYDRLTPTREMVEWEGSFLVEPITLRPLWRGDIVRLVGLGYYKIVSFGVEFEADHSEAQVFNARYVGEKVSDEPS